MGFIWIIIFYMVTIAPCYYVFKILNINRNFAFIPIYNVYLLGKEYKGRVFLNDLGIFFLVPLLIVFNVLMIIYSQTNKLVVGQICVFYFLFFIITFPTIIFWPLLTTRSQKILYGIVLSLEVLLLFMLIYSALGASDMVYLTFFLFIIPVWMIGPILLFVVIISIVYLPYSIYKGVVGGKYEIVEKYNVEEMSEVEYKRNVAKSLRCLVREVEDIKKDKENVDSKEYRV